MDARLLDYYERELAYLRELGGEFAARLPQGGRPPRHAGRRRVRPVYVERLLEGFRFP